MGRTIISLTPLVFTSVIMLGYCQVGCNYSRYGPSQIIWKEYSNTEKDSSLGDGKYVLVFVFPELNPESAWTLANANSEQIAKLTNDKEFVPLLLRYSDWGDPRIRSVWKDVGHTKKPMLVLYSPNGSSHAYDISSLMPIPGASQGEQIKE